MNSVYHDVVVAIGIWRNRRLHCLQAGRSWSSACFEGDLPPPDDLSSGQVPFLVSEYSINHSHQSIALLT